jgi:hypothetical protein
MQQPLMGNLPEVLDTSGWTWRRADELDILKDDFWVGTALDGSRWLCKFRGPTRAYREVVFGRLAQQLGWSCQSSAFIRLSDADAMATGMQAGELQGVQFYFDTHPNARCAATTCGFEPLIHREIRSIEDLQDVGISHILDWPRADFAANLFGANETSDRIFTLDHQFVIVDSELMFATGPCALSSVSWWKTPTGDVAQSAYDMAIEVCRSVASLSHEDLARALHAPQGVDRQTVNAVSARLLESHAYASKLANPPLSPDWRAASQ